MSFHESPMRDGTISIFPLKSENLIVLITVSSDTFYSPKGFLRAPWTKYRSRVIAAQKDLQNQKNCPNSTHTKHFWQLFLFTKKTSLL
jgi:hypothetical protein